MGPTMGLVSSWLPFVWITFTLALAVVALKIFFYWCFDLYSSSDELLNI